MNSAPNSKSHRVAMNGMCLCECTYVSTLIYSYAAVIHDGVHKRSKQSSPPVRTVLPKGLTARPRCSEEGSVVRVKVCSPLYTLYP